MVKACFLRYGHAHAPSYGILGYQQHFSFITSGQWQLEHDCRLFLFSMADELRRVQGIKYKKGLVGSAGFSSDIQNPAYVITTKLPRG